MLLSGCLPSSPLHRSLTAKVGDRVSVRLQGDNGSVQGGERIRTGERIRPGERVPSAQSRWEFSIGTTWQHDRRAGR